MLSNLAATPEAVAAASQALSATNPAEVEKTIKSLGPLQVEYNGKLYGDGKTLNMNPESLEGIIQGQSDIPLSCGFFLKNGVSAEAISWELKTSSGATLPLEAPLRISATPLTPGKRYAWQVRVQADAGFENQGYTTIGTFRYGTPPCEAPVNLTAEEDGGSVWFSWDAVEGAVSYTLSIDGKEHTLSKPPYLLQRTEAGNTYSYRVQTVCSGGSRSPVSTVQTLTIPSDEPEE